MQRALIAAGCAAVLLLPGAAMANRDPVSWSATVRERAPGVVTIAVRVDMERGWYIYGMRQPANGPTPLRFRVAGTTLTPSQVGAPNVRTSYDRGFRARVAKHIGASLFVVPLRLPEGTPAVPLEIRYQACNDQICLPPVNRRLDVAIEPANTR